MPKEYTVKKHYILPMTTNVNDLSASTLATDSRWSIHIPGHAICYIDDTGFDKIFVDKDRNFAASFAGNAMLIALWKEWLATDMLPPQPPVIYNGLSVCICLMDNSGKLLFHAHQDIEHQEDGSLFAGTGALYAYECWLANKCAKTAVQSAQKLDQFSGGSVVSIDFGECNHNIQNSISLQNLNAIFMEKGYVMYLNSTAQPVEFKTAAANDPKLAEVARNLSAGTVQLTAPHDRMYQDWTDEQKHALSSALGNIKKMYR